MSDGTSNLSIPEDLKACQKLVQEQSYLVASLSQSIVELQAKNQTLEQRSEEQKLTIADLLQRAFARRSERYIHDPNQLVLDFGAEAQDAADGLAHRTTQVLLHR